MFPLSNLKNNSNLILEVAAQYNNFDLVQKIIDRYPKTNCARGFHRAINKSYMDIAQFLLPQCAPASYASWINTTLVDHARRGNAEAVSFTIPLSNPKDNGSRALLEACCRNHTDCIDLLFPVSDPEAVLDFLSTNINTNHVSATNGLKYLEDKTLAQQQKHALQQVLGHVGVTATKRKM